MKKGFTLKGHRISIKFKLIISYVLIAALPLIIVNIISTASFKNNLRSTSMQLMTQMVSQTNVNINYFTADIEKNVSKFILNNLNSINGENLINGYASSDGMDRNRYRSSLTNELNSISIFESNIESALLLTENGDAIGDINGIGKEKALKFNEVEIPDEGLWYRDEELESGVYYIKKIKNSISGSNAGIFIGKINLEALHKEIGQINLFDESVICVVDENGETLCSSSENGKITDEIKSFISSRQSLSSAVINKEMVAYATGKNGWQIVTQIPMRNMTSSIEKVNVIVWFLVLGIGIAAILVGWFVSKRVIVSISELVEAMKQAEKGDLTVQVKVRGEDEMAGLCENFNHMISDIKRLITQTHNVIDSSIKNGNILNKSTEQSAEAFTQLAASIDEIARGSMNQADDAVKSSNVMNDLSESIQKVRHNTQNLFESTEGAKVMIENATDSIETLNMTMASSIKVSQQIKTSIVELGEMTQNIGQIMSFVDGISEQTNLLALNASIEAARAGEVGRGFAVVANEVRNLSEQSKTSTNSVRKTLGCIEEKSAGTVELVMKANKIFSQQAEAVESAYSAFKQIIQRLIAMDQELEHINAQVIDMQKIKDTMNDRIDHITTVTQENASATQEVNALSEQQKNVMSGLSDLSVELIKTMQELEENVQQFRI